MTLVTLTRVLLLRHGQSTWNAEGRWQGQSDPPLSEHGQAQAATAAQTLELSELDAVVTSDLARARQTAEIIGSARGLTPIRVLRGLRERDVGVFTGHTRTEIEALWPGMLHRVPLDPPGSESRPAVLARAVACLHRIAELHPKEVVLAVTHGALIRTLETYLGITEPGAPPNLAGRWITIDAAKVTAGPLADLQTAPAALT